MTRQEPGLSDVPETMLWTLHSRAQEALRPDGVFRDAKAVEIYQSLDYDYERSFGRSNPMAALRAQMFDDAVSDFASRYPDACIVNLGEGLETQRYRLSAKPCHWYTVDLPVAIAIRERFMTPDERHTHIAMSATDRRWMDHIPEGRPVLIAAQGLFMYFQEDDVRRLLGDIAERFPKSQIVFDVIPFWVSRASVIGRGLPLTRHYRTPAMPWGVHRHTFPQKLKRWIAKPCNVRLVDYPAFPRGPARLASRVFPLLPGARYWLPMLVEVTLR